MRSDHSVTAVPVDLTDLDGTAAEDAKVGDAAGRKGAANTSAGAGETLA